MPLSERSLGGLPRFLFGGLKGGWSSDDVGTNGGAGGAPGAVGGGGVAAPMFCIMSLDCAISRSSALLATDVE
jgi:hypothetical protein